MMRSIPRSVGWRCKCCKALIGAAAAWSHAYRGFAVTTCDAAYCMSRGPILAKDCVVVLLALDERDRRIAEGLAA